ncbi:hypothetical protein D8B26_003999 [Coccidioides posadasii str. Silveira]|uniref:Uncharacterized protein n=2 Tax=Coccidioides posadasii TaxID=199306 RepID=E9DJZ1_COCPS|nr:hypothetical protein CPC735_071380 [Coccidioides posadasii C735 delta SOWgp]EER29456.1 hypothetical protein CPC735_071380 [Coccidioides posadasii C735 delta SOWgp]EFW13270.1 conserved hypothetical protein [Coccidioides posadasii str. Silveira]QVM09336.1 hypothetical protein D8B26_003999 [Coccidioides posadasii str. Silveira]|eukprot:XP_003071601.1 hypothetical protein CPC735_071380 [Coccidioides posadasii C735 delta SOWgp]
MQCMKKRQSHPFSFSLRAHSFYVIISKMVVFNMSYTAPINQKGRRSLTASQIWECIERKVRNAEQFVSAIINTEILSESATEVTRRVTFAPHGHPAGAAEAVETCRMYKPCRVDFVAADGSTITNAVSVGPGGDEEFYYTYIFEWHHPEIAEGTPEASAQRIADWKVCRRRLTEHFASSHPKLISHIYGSSQTTKLAVEATIDTMHRLVAEGEVA